jgi:hypothetical protein
VCAAGLAQASCGGTLYAEAQPAPVAAGPGEYTAPPADDAVVEVDTVPPDIESYPSVYIDGGNAYYVEGRWYRRGPRGWGYYRREPPQLQRQRAYIQQAPPAQRERARVEQAPRAEPARAAQERGRVEQARPAEGRPAEGRPAEERHVEQAAPAGRPGVVEAQPANRAPAPRAAPPKKAAPPPAKREER